MKHILKISKEEAPSSFWIETNFFDYKLKFRCPECNQEWHTKEYSSLLDVRPTKISFNCHRVRGCGFRALIIFEWGS